MIAQVPLRLTARMRCSANATKAARSAGDGEAHVSTVKMRPRVNEKKGVTRFVLFVELTHGKTSIEQFSN